VTRMKTEAEEMGMRKTPEQVLADLTERGLLDVLQRAASAYHMTVLEVCSNGRELPVPQARLEVWTYLAESAPRGPGWSTVRIAEAWGLDPTTVSKTLQRQRAASKRNQEKP
jgi:hypothetical protein